MWNTYANHDENGSVVEVGELRPQRDQEPEGGECSEEGGHHARQANPRLQHHRHQ
jgi:hypothetical protein